MCWNTLSNQRSQSHFAKITNDQPRCTFYKSKLDRLRLTKTWRQTRDCDNDITITELTTIQSQNSVKRAIFATSTRTRFLGLATFLDPPDIESSRGPRAITVKGTNNFTHVTLTNWSTRGAYWQEFNLLVYGKRMTKTGQNNNAFG